MSDEALRYAQQVAIAREETKKVMELIKVGSESIESISGSPKIQEIHITLDSPLLLETAGSLKAGDEEFNGESFFLGVLAGSLEENGHDILVRYPHFDNQNNVVSHTEIHIPESELVKSMVAVSRSIGLEPYAVGRQLYYAASTLMNTWYGGEDPSTSKDQYYGEIGIRIMNEAEKPPGF